MDSHYSFKGDVSGENVYLLGNDSKDAPGDCDVNVHHNNRMREKSRKDILRSSGSNLSTSGRSSNTSATAQNSVDKTPGDSTKSTDNGNNEMSFLRVLYYAAFFLLGVILLEMNSLVKHHYGPLEFVSDWVHFKLGAGSSRSGSGFSSMRYDENGEEIIICPPDPYLDHHLFAKSKKSATAQNAQHAELYSPNHDPREIIPNKSVLPHCELSRWVQLQQSTQDVQCPKGYEIATVIRNKPPIQQWENLLKQHQNGQQQKQQKNQDNSQQQNDHFHEKIPNLIHLASPTNCIKSSTVKTMKQVLQAMQIDQLQHLLSSSTSLSPSSFSSSSLPKNYQEITIYIHSNASMDRFIFERNHGTFPEVKEGALVIKERAKVVTLWVLEKLGISGTGEVSTAGIANGAPREDRNVANQIAESVANLAVRDIWRYLILWEYGGVVLDIGVLSTILQQGTSSSLNAGNSTASTAQTMQSKETVQKILQSMLLTKNAEEDAIIFWTNLNENNLENDKQRMPFSSIMGIRPHHPFVYFTMKWALKLGMDTEQQKTAFNAEGRITDIASIQRGLSAFLPSYQSSPVGPNAHVGKDDRFIRFLNGDSIFPQSITSFGSETPFYYSWQSIFSAIVGTNNDAAPFSYSWHSIFSAVKSNVGSDSSSPSEVDIRSYFMSAEETEEKQNRKLFSSLKFRLDMYLQKTTEEI